MLLRTVGMALVGAILFCWPAGADDRAEYQAGGRLFQRADRTYQEASGLYLEYERTRASLLTPMATEKDCEVFLERAAGARARLERIDGMFLEAGRLADEAAMRFLGIYDSDIFDAALEARHTMKDLQATTEKARNTVRKALGALEVLVSVAETTLNRLRNPPPPAPPPVPGPDSGDEDAPGLTW